MSQPDAARRAREWRNALQAAVCDVVEPWAHGTVVRATRYPSYYDFNAVRVEEPTDMSAVELAALADEALAGLGHRRLDFDDATAAAPLRAPLEAAGWNATALVWMRHEAPAPAAPEIDVVELAYDAVIDLRRAWHRNDFEREPGDYLDNAREVAMQHGVRVLAVTEGEAPVAFAQLERVGQSAEITQVYVSPDRRGAGLGTAITRAAIEAAGESRDLWIVADAEGRPRELYARLGFKPAWDSVEFLRPPLAEVDDAGDHQQDERHDR